MERLDRDDDDFGEGFIAESHPLRPTRLIVPGRNESRAPSISSSVSDMDVPIYTRETTIPLSAKKVCVYILLGVWMKLISTYKKVFVL